MATESSQDRTSRFTWLTIALLWIGAATTVGVVSLLIWVGFKAVPNEDTWIQLENMPRLDNLLLPHNEHPILAGRLLFWLDWHVFQGRGVFLVGAIIGMLAVEVVLFVWLARRVGITRPSLVVAPVAVVAIFAATGSQNLVWPFQSSFVPVFTLALAGFAALASYAHQRSYPMLVAVLAIAIFSPPSLANGVLTPTFLAAMAVVLRLPRLALALGAIALAGWVWLFSLPTTLGNVNPVGPLEIGMYVLVYLGGVFGDLGETAAVLVGACVALLGGIALFFAFLRRSDPFILAVGMMVLFIFATAATTGVGRASLAERFGYIVAAAGSRYTAPLSMLYVAIFILLFRGSHGRIATIMTHATPVLGAVAVIYAATGAVQWQKMYSQNRELMRGEVALLANVTDHAGRPELLGFSGISPGAQEKLTAGAIQLRKERKSLFADPTAQRLGEVIPEATSVPACGPSSFNAVQTEHWGKRVSGNFARTSLTYGARYILLIDGAGKVVGYGRSLRRISDFFFWAQNDGRPVDWLGLTGADAGDQLRALLADASHVRCALGTFARN